MSRAGGAGCWTSASGAAPVTPAERLIELDRRCAEALAAVGRAHRERAKFLVELADEIGAAAAAQAAELSTMAITRARKLVRRVDWEAADDRPEPDWGEG